MVVQASRSVGPSSSGSGTRVNADRDRRVLAVAIGVVEARLEVGEHGLGRPRVGHHLVALVEQPLLVQLLHGPDDALHVGQLEGLVVVREVDPARRALDVVLPLAGVPEDRRHAVLVEAADPVLADGLVARDPELLLGQHLDGKAVAVPAEAALHPSAAQGLVAGDDVLDVAGDEVPVVGQAVREGRPVVEDELVAALWSGRALVDGLLEGPVPLPGRQDPLLDGRQVGLGIDVGIRLLRSPAAHGGGAPGRGRCRSLRAYQQARESAPLRPS